MGWTVLWWYRGHGMDGSVVVQGMDGYRVVCSVLQDLLMLKATSGATITCIEQCLSLLQGNQVRQDKGEALLSECF